MAEPLRQRLAHICILVKDIDQAIEHFTNILSAADPKLLERTMVKQESYAGEDRYVSAFFPAPGDACDIQLLQPLNPESPLYKRLQTRGEGVHHICFTSSNIEDTYRRLKERGVQMYGDGFVFDKEDPTMRWTWISPRYAHGLLIEVLDSYKAENGRLVRD